MLSKPIVPFFAQSIIQWVLCFVLISGFAPFPAGAADQNSTVIWNMRLSIERITESGLENNPHPIASGRVSLFESLSPLTLDFEIDHNIKIRDKSLKVDYKWKYEEKHWYANQLAYYCHGEENGNKLVDYSLAFKRHIKTGANEELLDVYDYDEMEKEFAETFKMFKISQPDNTFWLDYKTIISAKSSAIDYLSGQKHPESYEMLQSFDDYFTGPYRYDEKVNQETDRLMVTVPSLGIVKKMSYKISYRLERKNLTIEYHPQPFDMTYHPMVAVYKDGERRAKEPYLIKLVGKDWEHTGKLYHGWAIHGNNMIIPKVEGVDKSDTFNTIRFMREWLTPIDENDRIIGKYIMGKKWHNDNLSGKPSWVDVPGCVIVTEADQWTASRYLQEYLVAVERFPEFGFLYYIVVVDTKPNQYRVRMYKAKHIKAEEWAMIKKSPQPYLNEVTGQLELDSGWRQPWNTD